MITELPTMTLRPKKIFRYRNGEILKEGPHAENGDVIRFAMFLKGIELFVTGNVTIQRAIEMGNPAGQSHAEVMLERQEDIPKELRDYILIFSGTEWDVHGVRRVPCLIWAGDKRGWVMRFDAIECTFHKNFLVALVGD